MASSPIHLAIAKKYIEKNINLNKEEVLKGTIYPDTIKDKNTSHYADLTKRGKDNVSHLQGKVNLYSFLLDHPTLDDFEFGWFLHLITDYLFFEECFTKEYLLSHTFDEFRKDLCFGYDCLNQYLTEKYKITREDFTIYPEEIYPGIPYQDNIFTKEQIDEFISRVSEIDTNQYIKKIKIAKCNIKPY